MLYSEIVGFCSEIHTKVKNTLCGQDVEFWGAFTKLRKAIISFVMSVHPHGTIRLQLDRFWWNFVFRLFFRRFVEEIQVLLNLTRITGTLHKDVFTFMTISRWIIIRIRNNNNGTLQEDIFTFVTISRLFHVRMRNVLDKSCWENQNKFYVQ